MIERAWAEELARDWIEGWNSHDLERVLAHYADDFEMTSPLIVQRFGIVDGKLRGKDAVRRYWAQGWQIPLNFVTSSSRSSWG